MPKWRRMTSATRAAVHSSLGQPWATAPSSSRSSRCSIWASLSRGLGPGWGLAARPWGRERAAWRQRYREGRPTPRMRAMVVGDSPWSISSTARRRRRSSSAGVPVGLLIHRVRGPRPAKDSLSRLASVTFGLNQSSFLEGNMRAYLVVAAVVGVILAAQAGTLRGDPGKETGAERIARLIKQLGDAAFKKRQAATEELQAIGAPALAALRRAAASSEDAEIRRRAEHIGDIIAEAVAKAQLAKLQG